MSRKYADYEYSINDLTVRVEKTESGRWIWRILEKSIASHEIAEDYKLKREAISAAKSFINIEY